MFSVKNHPFYKPMCDIAKELHKHHTYGDKNYFDGHLKKVSDIVAEHDNSPVAVGAALFHDVYEDVENGPKRLRHALKGMGMADDHIEKIENAVHSVTDEPGKNRHEKKERTYWKIRKNPTGLLVKLADRVANTSDKDMNDPLQRRKAKKYLDEYHTFKSALWEPGQHEALWKTLDDNHEKFKEALKHE